MRVSFSFLSSRSSGENVSLSASAVAAFLMKRGEPVQALFSIGQYFRAPNAAVKWGRILSFAPIAGKGSHEACVDQAKKGPGI